MSTLNQVKRRVNALLEQKRGPDKITTIEVYYVDADGENRQLVETIELTPGGVIPIYTVLEDSK